MAKQPKKREANPSNFNSNRPSGKAPKKHPKSNDVKVLTDAERLARDDARVAAHNARMGRLWDEANALMVADLEGRELRKAAADKAKADADKAKADEAVKRVEKAAARKRREEAARRLKITSEANRKLASSLGRAFQSNRSAS